MPIKFSEHAKEKLRNRKIPQKLALQVVQNPHEVIPSFRFRKLRRKTVGGRILQIITVTEGSRITVISGFYLRGKK